MLNLTAETQPTMISCHQDTLPNIQPLRELRIELLRGCPLHCAHCSAHAAPNYRLQLPLVRVLTLLDQFVDLGGRRLTLTGGEPLSYPYLTTVLQKTLKMGLETRIFSSGIILSRDGRVQAIEESLLKKLGPLVEEIIFSIYAASGPQHDAVTRVHGSFEATVEALRRTVSAKIRTGIHFVPTKANYVALPEIVALVAEMHVEKVVILRFVAHGRGKSNRAALELDFDSHKWIRQQVLALREKYPQVTLQVGSAYNVLHIGEPTPCTAGIDQLVIQADGRIAPCSAFGHVSIDDEYGSIVEHSLETVWKHSAYLAQVRQAIQVGGSCGGCLAQKAIAARRIDPMTLDPLEMQAS